MHLDQQKTITGSQGLNQKWKKFQQQLSLNKKPIKGKFIFETLEYDPYIIDLGNRGNWFKRTFHNKNNQLYQRSYLIYLPPILKNDMQIILLLHGTNETIFDTELVIQVGQQQNQKNYGLIQLADQKNYVILVPQSRGIQYRGKQFYGWQPGELDLKYLMTILQKITQKNYSKEKNLPYFTISPQNISVLGFSNGGIFSTDLYLTYTAFEKQAIKNKFSILIFIDYMGGIQYPVSPLQLISFDPERKINTPMIIITCKKDQNYGPCLRAFKFLQHNYCNVHFVQINHHKHQFTYFAVTIVGEWIEKAKNKSIVCLPYDKTIKQGLK